MIYTLKQFPDKKFTDKMDQTRFIKENIKALSAMKKAEYKTFSDVVLKDGFDRSNYIPEIEDITGDYILVKAIINTTGVIDSHLDLHLPKIWNKTVKDNPTNPVLKQHERMFESVIDNKGRNFNQNMNFKDIGVDIDFEMQANLNEFVVSKSNQPLMFEKYASGEVTQHSVGMMYVDYDIAYYDETSQKEMDFFNETLKQCINPEIAEEAGVVWVIREAKKREGSPVVFASNPLTPTLSVKKYEPQTRTRSNTEPPVGTSKSTQFIFNPNLF
jgi:histidinol phosphatase-like enzyme